MTYAYEFKTITIKRKNMLITTNKEFRLHNPSNAVDEVNLLQGIIDNSEKDFLREKLGGPLYDRLCEYYAQTSPEDFYLSVTSGTYTADPYAVLLLYAQRVIVNDALTRYAYQQAVSLNGAGVNMASSDDYASASDKMIDKAVQGYKKEAFASLNALLVMLEEWAKQVSTPMPIDGQGTGESVPKNDDSVQKTAILEIVNLWQQSKYYYLHANLLIPTCTVLQRYLDIYENRDKFIRLLPDLLFIQEEYIEDVIGEDLVQTLLHADDRDHLLKKVRRLMVSYLEERTTILSIDKTRRQQAHNEGIALKASVLAIVNDRKKAEAEATTNEGSTPTPSTDNNSSDEGYKNNHPGSRMFVSPLLY